MLPELRASDPIGVERMFEKANLVPNAQGRLWRVEKAGALPSHLFGTFHSSEALETVTPQIWSLLEASRIALFEVDLNEQGKLEARMASDPSFAFDLDGPGVLSAMDLDQQKVFTQALAERGVDANSGDRMRPWLLAALLSFPACHLKAMSSGAQALDGVLARRAVALGIEESGLETYDVALESLNRIDEGALLDALTGVPEMLDRDEDLFRTNHALYSAGKIQAIEELGIYLTERLRPDLDAKAINEAMMVELLDVRNRAWMPKLKAELALGGAFVGIGALHLPGHAGLVELLRQAGFEVTRVQE